MRFGSFASGIEAASVAWKPLGMRPAFFSEVDKFCGSLLSQRHSDAPNLGDMNEITTHALRRCGRIRGLIAGTPCQSFSVAGDRGGLEDCRGQLALRAIQLVEYLQPEWFVWENVPGVLSSNSGRDFGTFIATLAKLGYGWAYRVLDAQYFGVPQRRRRVFVVGHLGDWRRAAAVLFEPDSLYGNLKTCRQTQQEIAGTITSGSGRRRGAGVNPSEIVAALTACGVGTCCADDNQAQAGHIVPALTTKPFADRESEEGKLVPVAYRVGGDGDVWESGERVAALTTGTDPNSHVLVYGGANTKGPITKGPITKATACNAKGGTGRTDFDSETFIVQRAVRRLTPRECERLQGFPDDYTLITHRGKPAVDGPRYKAIGNSIAIPVLEWIGQRIQQASG